MTQDHNTATHTPGPWLIGEEQCVYECWSIVTTSGGAIIANVNDNAKRRSNARLIAAAPDMLEALRAVLRCNALPDGSPVGGGGGSSYASHLQVAGMVSAAIAKAEGRK